MVRRAVVCADVASIGLFLVRGVSAWASLLSWLTLVALDAVLCAPYWSLCVAGVCWAAHKVWFGAGPHYHNADVPIPAAPYSVEEHARALEFLPPYPDGWYKLYREREVVAGGKVRVAHVLGQHFAVYRLADGTLKCRDVVPGLTTIEQYEASHSKSWHIICWAHIVLVYYTMAPIGMCVCVCVCVCALAFVC